MLWTILGWIVVTLLGVSILYSGAIHSHNYANIQAGGESELRNRFAKRYIWNTIIWQLPKVGVIVILLNLLF